MFDPQAVISQAMLGETPADWEVFHGKRPSPLSMGCFFAFVIPLFVGMFAIVAMLVTQLVFNLLHVHLNVTSFIPIVGLIALDTIMIQMRANIRRNMSITKLRVWLELHYPDGRVKKWKPKGMYGDNEDVIVQSIVTAFTDYAHPPKEYTSPREEYAGPGKEYGRPRKRRRKR